MTRRLLSTAVVIACATTLLAQPDPLREAWTRVDEYATTRMSEMNTPGMSLAITSRDRLLYVGTYGFANVDAKRPIMPDTLFQIGSISKSFTAVALLQMHDEGAFDPQVPITRYLPWFQIKSKYAPVTGHHLMSHTAGCPRLSIRPTACASGRRDTSLVSITRTPTSATRCSATSWRHSPGVPTRR